MKLLLLLLSLSSALFAAKPSPCDLLFMDNKFGIEQGLFLLDAGENTKAAQYFKDAIAYENTVCNDDEKRGPYQYLYVTVADYRRGAFDEAKQYLMKMFERHETYYRYDYINVAYACLIATKTNDIELFRKGLFYVDPIFGWGQSDHKDFAKASLRHAIKNLNLDAETKSLANKKLAMIK